MNRLTIIGMPNWAEARWGTTVTVEVELRGRAPAQRRRRSRGRTDPPGRPSTDPDHAK